MGLKWTVILAVVFLAAQVNAEETPVLKTENDKVSYAIGIDMARNFKSSGIQVDLDALVMGMRDVFSGEKLIMSNVDLLVALGVYQEELNQGKGRKLTGYVSYAVGVDMARKFKPLGIELNVDVLAKGLRDFFAGETLLMDGHELRLTLNKLQSELKQRRAQSRRVQAKGGENTRKEGEAFLARNKTKEGVVTLPSGLQYKILKTGDGKKPKEADTVEVNYRGTLINGTEFDSSYKRKQSASFKVMGVIPGWREALKLMPVGSRWQLFIPPQLAYGAWGKGDQIGPNATLIFEIELLAIK
jgi:FKBP-type peptidyl-prolyl cis-trans isomerase FklB